MSEIIKVAFFVEGYTEQEFLKRLLIEVFNTNEIGIEISEAKGGSSVKFSFTTLETPKVSEQTKYYILIYNCGGDSAIKSFIIERRQGLIQSGYKKIIGFRDLFPEVTREEKDKLLQGLYFKLPQKDIQISFVLSIMEIESWFLAEENHYSQIDPKLTNELIYNTFGFDPTLDNTEIIDEAANTLKSIYQLVGKTYKKEQSYIDRTISSLDFHNLYFNVNNRIPSFKDLTDEVNSIFKA